MLRILANFLLNGHHRKHLLCLMDVLSIGIPMGTTCTPLLVDFLLFSFETDCMQVPL